MNLNLYTKIQRDIILSMYHFPEQIPNILERVLIDNFINPIYQNLFIAISNIYSTKTEISTLNIWNEYKQLPKSDPHFEDLDFLIELPEETVETLIPLLIENHVVYKAEQLLQQSIEELNFENPVDVFETIHGELNRYTERLITKKITNEEKLSLLKETILTKTEEDYISTPYPSLNKYLKGGFKGGELITIGGRTGKGKTVLSTNIMMEACRNNKRVVYFSLEMSENELLKRLIACHGNIMLNNLDSSNERPDWVINKIGDTIEEIKKWKYTIEDSSDVTIGKIKGVCNKLKQTDGLDLVVVDYLQLLSTKGMKTTNRAEQVSEFSRSMKILARELNVPIIILVQLNRETKEESEDRLPSKADIKESSSIAADSDIVIIIHRKNRDDSDDPKATMILDKNRRGPADKFISLRCVLEKNIFQDLKEGIEETSENTQGFGNIEDIKETIEDDFDDLFG